MNQYLDSCMSLCTPAQTDTVCGKGFGCDEVPEDCSDPDKDEDGGGQGGPEVDGCFNKEGADPIHLSSKAALTEPFTDFSVEAVTSIKLTRTYSSADASIPKPWRQGGPIGIFGRGWHHNWEASVSCAPAQVGGHTCTLARGLQSALEFDNATVVAGPGGNWDVLTRRNSIDQMLVGQREVLVRKPDGEFVAYMTDGAELRFRPLPATDCGCGAEAALCGDPWNRGKAALVAVVDPRGNVTTVSRDYQSGLLLSLMDSAVQDATGAPTALEIHSNGCNDTRARSLSFDRDRSKQGAPETTYLTYEYDSSDQDLQQVLDPASHRIRQYDYYLTMPAHLQLVINESGATIAEFGYHPTTLRATSVHDASSYVTVDYQSAGTFTAKSQKATSGGLVRTHQRSRGRSSSVALADGSTYRLQWLRRKLQCFEDPEGRVTYVDRDSENRVTLVRKFAKEVYSCSSASAPATSLATVFEERYWYGLTRTIVGTVAINLNVPTQTRTTSVMAGRSPVPASGTRQRNVFFSPSGHPGAPQCWADGVAPPSGSAPCWTQDQGWTMNASGQIVEDRRVTYYSYDRFGRVTLAQGPVSLDQRSSDDVTPVQRLDYYAVTDATREHRGRLRKVTQFTGGVDANGAPKPENAFWVDYTYVANGPASISDASGASYGLVVDSRGRIATVTGPSGATRVDYSDGNEPSLLVRPGGGAVRIKHDGGFGRVSDIEMLDSDPTAPGALPKTLWTEKRAYDLAGNPTSITRLDSAGTVRWSQTREYDEDHKLLNETHPTDGLSKANWSYDRAGSLVAMGDELDQWTEFPPKIGTSPVYAADDLGRPLQVDRARRNSLGEVLDRLTLATYTWEANSDGLKSVTDANGFVTTYDNDDFGRVVSVAAPSTWTGLVRLVWDARGNLKKRIHGPTTTVYSYDGRNRLVYQSVTSTSGAASTSTSFTYDQVGTAGRVGKLLSATTGRRTTTYTWHPSGQLAGEQVAIAGAGEPLTTTYGYDADGVLTSLTLPSGFGVTYTPNKAMEIQEVKVTGSNRVLASAIKHEPGGPIDSLVYGNGLTRDPTYNERYEPSAIADGPLALTYTIGRSGNVDAVSGASDTRTFTHDLLGRLATMTPGHGPGTPTLTYKYSGDRVVQALEETTPGQVPRYAFGYDAVGNLSAVSTYAGAAVASTTCLLHDAASRLVAVGPAKTLLTSPGGTACQAEADVASFSFRFEYDAWNRRVWRWSAATGAREFIHDPAGHLLAELKSRSTTLVTYEASREYVWLDGRPLAQLEYPGPAGRAEGYTYYFHLDHLGQPRALSNESRALVWSATPSRPYGDVAEVTTVDPLTGRVVTTELRLPGQYDERLFAAAGISGLQGPYQNWNRWYLPTMGRYMELDPNALSGGFNAPFAPSWYAYAEGSPLRRTDPRGLDATDQWNTADGCRLPFLVTGSAPTNGMWCGDKWSGGSGTCRGQGQSPPTDSLDLACMQHDLCYSECSSHRNAALMQACNVLCDRALIRDVRCLGPDPSKWPGPPRPGTGGDTANYRESLLTLFGCPPKERNTCPR